MFSTRYCIEHNDPGHDSIIAATLTLCIVHCAVWNGPICIEHCAVRNGPICIEHCEVWNGPICIEHSAV